MSERRIIFTHHAALMLTERRIERAWAERTLNEPETVEPDPARSDAFRAFRAIPERDGRVLRVVYAATGEELIIITAFFDRTRRR
jgi:hypothetical protein